MTKNKDCSMRNKKDMVKRVSDTSEDQAQAHICSWCLQNGLVPVAIPNGFNLGGAMSLFKKYGISTKELQGINAKQMQLLKKEGLHTGFPDLMIFGESKNGIHLIFMENKVKRNKPSEIQMLCHNWLRGLGFRVEVSYNSIDAISKIKDYFDIKSTQAFGSSYIQSRTKLLKKKRRVK